MVGEVVADRYELEELVGTGGMSSVYRARDRLLERQVAIKVLHEHYSRDDDYVERFRREARAAAKLSHPNIVTVIDRGEAGGRQFIVFEYIDGENLKQLVSEQGAAAGTDGARARDPDRPRARLRPRPGARPSRREAAERAPRQRRREGDRLRHRPIHRRPDGLTQTGTVLGTSEYISPEQASGRQVDARTDIYSLGAVLYELLAGQPPYSGDSFVAVAMRHVNDPVPGITHARPDVPLRVDAALRRAMAKDPDDRFQTMEELVAELSACLDGPRRARRRPDSDRRRLRSQPRARPQRRRRRWSPLAFLLVAVGRRGRRGGRLLRRAPHGRRRRRRERHRRRRRCTWSRRTRTTPRATARSTTSEVPNATDGDPATYWATEDYRGRSTSAVSRTASGSSSTRAAR